MFRTNLRRFVVVDESMLPNLHPGDGLIAIRSNRLRRGQVRVFTHPHHRSMWLVKRVAAIRNHSFEALSDNRHAPGAVDSRSFGDVPVETSMLVVFHHAAR